MFEKTLISFASLHSISVGSKSGQILGRIESIIEGEASLNEAKDILELFHLLTVYGGLSGDERKCLIESLTLDAEQATNLRFIRKSVSSLWGVTPINNLIPCASGDRLLGINSKTFVYTNYYVQSNFDFNLKSQVEWVLQNKPEKIQAFGWMIFYWALINFDIFHFFNDRGLLWDIGGYGSERFGISLQEMQILRQSSKRLYTYNYGADHRMRQATLDMGQYNFCTFCIEVGKHCVCDDVGGMKMLQTIKSYTNAMCASGLGRILIPWARDMNHLVIDLSQPKFQLQQVSRLDDGILRIAHAPNHSFFKGTHFLEKAIEQLKIEGYQIEYVKISGVNNEQVIELMRSSDLVADQFISGAYGYIAIEAFALGKPVLCYISEQMPFADGQKPPVIEAHPEHVTDVLRDLIKNPRRLQQVQLSARQYAEQHYSVEVFSKRLREMYLETALFPGLINKAFLGKKNFLFEKSSHYGLIISILKIKIKKIKKRLRVLKLLYLKKPLLRLKSRVMQSAHRIDQISVAVVHKSLLISSGIVLTVAVFVGRLMSYWRFRTGKIRTLWGVTPILTLPLLVRCDRSLGFQSDSLVFQTYVITQNFDINLSKFQKIILDKVPILYEPFLHLVLAFALIRYDVFHYFYDRGILAPKMRMGIHPNELKYLTRAGKALFTFAYGADVRLRNSTIELGKYNLCSECPEPGRFCVCYDVEGTKNITQISQAATAMISMGDMLKYVPGAINMHYWPIDTKEIKYVGVRGDWGKPILKIAHITNHDFFKGTRFLLNAVTRLKSEGFLIEVLSIQGVANHRVIDLYSQADIVADQFIAGFHGYAALEAMALGKPVISYLRDKHVMCNRNCPIINTSPETLYLVLKDILMYKIDLIELGQKSRNYIEENYSIDAVASNLARLYQTHLPFPKV